MDSNQELFAMDSHHLNRIDSIGFLKLIKVDQIEPFSKNGWNSPDLQKLFKSTDFIKIEKCTNFQKLINSTDFVTLTNLLDKFPKTDQF